LLDHQRVQVLQLLRFSYSRGIPPILVNCPCCGLANYHKNNPSTAQF